MTPDALRTALAAIAPLPAPALDAWVALAEVRRFAAGDWLLRGGERATTCHWVVSGLVRELYLSADGDEHTRAFVAEGSATGSLLDLLAGGPAVTWIEALEPTVTWAWPWAAQEALAERYPAVHHLMRRVAEALYVRKARREHQMLALTAEERYEQWLAEHAALDPRVRRRHLASYLGITAEHLSRIARRATR